MWTTLHEVAASAIDTIGRSRFTDVRMIQRCCLETTCTPVRDHDHLCAGSAQDRNTVYLKSASMKHTTLLLLFLPVALAHGQDFPMPTTDARWVCTLYGVEPIPPPVTYTLWQANNYCANGQDTTINSTSYTKLEYCSGGYKGAFRNDAGRVYYVPGDSLQEFLLYDFTLSDGETATDVYFEPAWSGEGWLADVTVSNTSISTEYEGRKVLYLQAGGTWIEGIGAQWGLLSEPWVNVSNYELRLECMSHADTLRYPVVVPGAGACELIMGVADPESSTLGLHPNPTDGLVTISGLPQQGPMSITVFGVDGRSVRTEGFTASNLVQVDLSALPSGVYVIEAIIAEQRIRGTVVRQ